MSNITHYRYDLPSVKHEGWASIVVGSDGFFAAVSDYGNYAFRWGHRGCEMREFLLGIEPDYMAGKLSPEKKLDVETTVDIFKKEICLLRRGGGIAEMEARFLWDSLSDVGYEYDLSRWYDEYGSDYWDAGYEMFHHARSSEVTAFVTKILPRLKREIATQLSKEKESQAVTP